MMAKRKKVFLVGYGEISRKQHLPMIESLDMLELAAIVDPILVNETGPSGKVNIYPNLEEAFLATNTTKEADGSIVVIACPPEFAQDYAAQALSSGSSVFMEKPPGFDCQRLTHLEDIARKLELTLFTGYHSAYSPQMNNAKAWISNHKPLQKILVTWNESIRRWHPNFEHSWIIDGKFGVLDILFNPMTMIDELLGAGSLSKFELDRNKSSLVIPKNWNGPISGATTLTSSGSQKCDIIANFTWDLPDDEQDVWAITFESYSGQKMELRDGGGTLFVDGVDVERGLACDVDILRPEYERLYHRFVELMNSKACEVRTSPLRVMLSIIESSKNVVVQHY